MATVEDVRRMDEDELRELLIDAWCMVMPKTIAAKYLESQGIRRT